MDALTTWLQVCDSYGHSTVSQTPYLTHEVLPYLHFSLAPTQTRLFQPIVFSLSNEFVSQHTTERLDFILALPQF